MKYACDLCEHQFDHAASPPPKRCPECLKKNGLRPLKASATASAPGALPRWALILGAAALLSAAAYGAYAVQAPEYDMEGPVPVTPLSAEALREFAQAKSIRLRGTASLFTPSDELSTWADSAASSADSSTPSDLAASVVAQIAIHRAAEAFVAWSRTSPRDTAPRNAGDTTALISGDGGEAKLYPLEAALFAASALREIDVPAMVTEVYQYPEENAPPDPNGHLGYFGIAIPSADGSWTHFDPYMARETTPDESDVRVLTDLQVAAAFLSHHAEYNLVHEGEERRALEQSTEAVQLDPRSPAIRTVRGAVLLATGAGPDGIEELQSAMQLRRDATRRNNVASLHVIQGDLERAQREVVLALEQSPGLAAAHATLASLALQRGEYAEAQESLMRAQALDPDLVNLAMLWANYHLMRGDLAEATRYAQEAVEANPHDMQARLSLGRIHRQTGQYEAMREQARQVVALTPSSRRQQMRELVLRMLGPTALEEPFDIDEELPADEAPTAVGDTSNLDLQLGDPEGEIDLGATADGPSLLGDERLQGGQGLPNGDEASTLRLRDPTEGLRLEW